MLASILAFVLAVVGYAIVARRPGHTRVQLVGSAMVGGGLAGALVACAGALLGQSFEDLLPFALIGLATGAFVGFAGVLAFAVGKWLMREP